MRFLSNLFAALEVGSMDDIGKSEASVDVCEDLVAYDEHVLLANYVSMRIYNVVYPTYMFSFFMPHTRNNVTDLPTICAKRCSSIHLFCLYSPPRARWKSASSVIDCRQVYCPASMEVSFAP